MFSCLSFARILEGKHVVRSAEKDRVQGSKPRNVSRIHMVNTNFPWSCCQFLSVWIFSFQSGIFAERKMCSSAGCSKFFCVFFSLAGLILSIYSLHVKTQVCNMHEYNEMLSIIHFCLIFSWIKMRTTWLSVISMRGCPAQSKLAISALLDQTIFDLTLSLFRVFSSPYARGFGLVSPCTML